MANLLDEYNVFKPFPSEDKHLEQEREKVNEIVLYFNRMPISSLHTFHLCQKSEKNSSENHLLQKAISVIPKIFWANSRSSINTLTQLLGEIYPTIKSQEDPIGLMLGILHFIRGFLFENENLPSEGIQDYLRSIVIICHEDYNQEVVYDEMEFLLSLIMTKSNDGNSLILADNFDLMRTIFEQILPKLHVDFKPNVLRYILGEGLVEQKKYSLARKCFQDAIDMPMTMYQGQAYVYWKLGTIMRIVFCLIKLQKFGEAFNLLNNSCLQLKPECFLDEEMLELRKNLGDIFLQLNQPRKAIEILESAIDDGLKIYGMESLANFARDCIVLTLCGLAIDNQDTVKIYTTPILPPKNYSYESLSLLLKAQVFQSNVVPLLNILQLKIVEPNLKSKKPRSKQSCQTDQKKIFRLFKNSTFICYFTRKLLN